jgi:hypothetical protein
MGIRRHIRFNDTLLGTPNTIANVPRSIELWLPMFGRGVQVNFCLKNPDFP